MLENQEAGSHAGTAPSRSSCSALRYRNPWHKPGVSHYGPEFYTTSVKPIDYRGFQIVHRFKHSHELVKDGVCLTIRAGRNGPRQLADTLLGDASNDCPFNVARARAIAKEFGVSLPVQS